MITFLTLREASEHYSVPVTTIKSWIYQKRLEARKIYGDCVGKQGFKYMVRSDKLEHIVKAWTQTQQSYSKRSYQVLQSLPPGEVYFTPVEVAALLKMTKASVLAWIKRGHLHAIRIRNYRVIRIPRKSLELFLKQCHAPRMGRPPKTGGQIKPSHP